MEAAWRRESTQNGYKSLAMGAVLPWDEVCAIWRKMKKHLCIVSSLRTLPPILAAKNLSRQEGHESTIRETTGY